jgi:outer membrane receptor protein involved in Fe transport
LLIVDEIPYLGDLTDINIDDVKSITVLKGLSATTLYGNEGRNGG